MPGKEFGLAGLGNPDERFQCQILVEWFCLVIMTLHPCSDNWVANRLSLQVDSHVVDCCSWFDRSSSFDLSIKGYTIILLSVRYSSHISSLSAFQVMACSQMICRGTVNLMAISRDALGMTNALPCKDVTLKLVCNMQIEMVRDLLGTIHVVCL